MEMEYEYWHPRHALWREGVPIVEFAGNYTYRGFIITLYSVDYDFEYKIEFPNQIWSSGPYYHMDFAIDDAKRQIDLHLEAGGAAVTM